MVNVFDDTVGCAVVQNFCKRQLNLDENGNAQNDLDENDKPYPELQINTKSHVSYL